MAKKIIAFLITVCCFFTAYAQKEKGLGAITMNSIQSQMAFLSSDLMRGRRAGTEDAARTAEYLSSQFGSLGLKPFDLSSKGFLERYMQPFSAVRSSEYTCALSLETTSHIQVAFTEGVDYVLTGKSDFNGTITAPLAPFDPTASHKGLVVYYYGDSVAQVSARVKEQGAVALLICSPSFWKQRLDLNAFRYHYNEAVYEGFALRKMFGDVRMALDTDRSEPPFLQIYISESVNGYLKEALGSTLSVSCKTEKVYLRNVLGIIEGTKPDEFVVIGAHYDHLGVQDGYIYNGADDNASGVTAVLQIAKAFVASGEKPRKSIIFALWDGEEYGLLGSHYFVENYPYLKDVKGYMNFDMIGRNNDESQPQSVVYFYTASQSKFEKWMRNHIEQYKLELQPLYKPWDKPVGGSDNASFARYDIPVIWYHTDGHPDYHQPTDHASKINWSKMQDIIRSAYLNFYNMAND